MERGKPEAPEGTHAEQGRREPSNPGGSCCETRALNTAPPCRAKYIYKISFKYKTVKTHLKTGKILVVKNTAGEEIVGERASAACSLIAVSSVFGILCGGRARRLHPSTKLCSVRWGGVARGRTLPCRERIHAAAVAATATTTLLVEKHFARLGLEALSVRVVSASTRRPPLSLESDEWYRRCQGGAAGRKFIFFAARGLPSVRTCTTSARLRQELPSVRPADRRLPTSCERADERHVPARCVRSTMASPSFSFLRNVRSIVMLW